MKKPYSRDWLKDVLKYEKRIYMRGSFLSNLIMRAINDERYLIWKYLIYLRKHEYYASQKSFLSKLMGLLYCSKKNRIGNRIDVKILPFYVGKGVNIYHKGIVINGYVGENCMFHGRNCIGNNIMGQGSKDDIPTLGNNVDIGVGANIIGNVCIADGIKIGANALVNKSFEEANIVIAGVPAKRIK